MGRWRHYEVLQISNGSGIAQVVEKFNILLLKSNRRKSSVPLARSLAAELCPAHSVSPCPVARANSRLAAATVVVVPLLPPSAVTDPGAVVSVAEKQSLVTH